MTFPKLKLTYFDIAGLAEAIRLTFAVGGVPFEDERLSDVQFAADKAAGRFKNGQVPVLDVDGVQIAQSNAILIYAGKLAGLYPWDPLQALKVEEFLSTVDDIGGLFRPAYGEQDKAKRAAAWAEVAAGPLKVWYGRIDAALAKSTSGYIVGNSLTIADLRAFVYWGRRVDGVPADYISQFPHISAHFKKIGNHPLVAEYYASRSHPKLKLTYFDGRGRAQAIRYTLFAGGIPFIDERLTGAQFAEAKASGRFKNGQVPVLEVDGRQLAQSNAILIYAGKLAGLYPWDPVAALQAEEFLSTVEDASAAFSAMWAEPDLAKRAALIQEIADGAGKVWFERIEATLSKSASGYIAGDALSIADLRAYAIWSDAFGGVLKTYLEQFKHIQAHKALVAAHPKIAEYDTYRK